MGGGGYILYIYYIFEVNNRSIVLFINLKFVVSNFFRFHVFLFVKERFFQVGKERKAEEREGEAKEGQGGEGKRKREGQRNR